MASERTTRDRLLDAVVDRVADAGAGAVSIADVRAQVGVSVGAIYHHFADRQALLDAAWLRCLASHQAALLGAIDAADDARAGIVGGATAYLEWHGRHRAEALMLREPGPSRDRAEAWKARAALNRPFFGSLLGWWSTHADAGELRPLSPVLIHALWLGPARDLCDLWLQGAFSGAVEDHADEIGAAAWRAVAAA
jgi:AcrR family transcriptional regulator